MSGYDPCILLATGGICPPAGGLPPQHANFAIYQSVAGRCSSFLSLQTLHRRVLSGIFMTTAQQLRNGAYALGIAIENGVVELCAVNYLNTVIFHGWFDLKTGFDIMRRRPPSLIAVQEDVLPGEFVTQLDALGHSVLVVPTPINRSGSSVMRDAKYCCEIAVKLRAETPEWMGVTRHKPVQQALTL